QKRILLLFIAALFVILIPYLEQVKAQTDPVTITVDATQELNEISPFTISANHAPDGTSMQAAEYASAINWGFIRFPHGNWGDLNDLTPFHIDLYMAEIRRWGATPSINVRFLNSTPEDAANLVRYTNVEND